MRRSLLSLKTHNSSDVYQTPVNAANLIIDYVKSNLIKVNAVWECAAGYGLLGDELSKAGFEVLMSDLCSHNEKIKEIDFLNHSKLFSSYADRADMIITNPPFSVKDLFIRQCYKLSKPFALLLPLTALEGIKRQQIWKEGLTVLIPNRRIHFLFPDLSFKNKRNWFACAWFIHAKRDKQTNIKFVDMEI